MIRKAFDNITPDELFEKIKESAIIDAEDCSDLLEEDLEE